MARIPLPDGFNEVADLPRSRTSLQNCFNNLDGRIVARPGIQELNETGTQARGQFVFDGILYQVSGERLLKVTDPSTGVFEVVVGATVAGTADIRTAVSSKEVVILVRGGDIYSLTIAGNFALISDEPNFVTSIDVAQINGRFVYIPEDGSPAFFSNITSASDVDSDNFFDAEELPDKNNSVFNFRNTLYIGGTDSFQQFRDVGTTPNPFFPIPGSRIQNGFIGGLIEAVNTFFFIGRETNQGFGIYAIAAGAAVKISNEGIDLILSTYTQEELGNAISGRLKWHGYDIATFALARDSFGFLGGNWFILNRIDADDDLVPWGGGFIQQFEGVYYTAFEGKIGKFADAVHSDYGDRVPKLIDATFEQTEDEWFSAQSLDLGISQGFTTENDATVGLATTRDGVVYGSMMFRKLGNIGDYGKRLIWNYPGGLGRYKGFMGVRLYTTQNVNFSTNHMVVKLQ